jgi:hypothetical protein
MYATCITNISTKGKERTELIPDLSPLIEEMFVFIFLVSNFCNIRSVVIPLEYDTYMKEADDLH